MWQDDTLGYVWEISMRFCRDVKRRGAARPQACMDAFKEALDDCGMTDLGFTGDPFTWWNNNNDDQNYIRERLDRAFTRCSS